MRVHRRSQFVGHKLWCFIFWDMRLEREHRWRVGLPRGPSVRAPGEAQRERERERRADEHVIGKKCRKQKHNGLRGRLARLGPYHSGRVRLIRVCAGDVEHSERPVAVAGERGGERARQEAPVSGQAAARQVGAHGAVGRLEAAFFWLRLEPIVDDDDVDVRGPRIGRLRRRGGRGRVECGERSGETAEVSGDG